MATLITVHLDGVHRQRFDTADAAVEAGKKTDPDRDGSMVPNIDLDENGENGDLGIIDANYHQGLFWLGNRYGVVTTD